MKKIIYPTLSVLFLAACSTEEEQKTVTPEEEIVTIDYLHLGDSLTNNAQSTLLSNVAGAIQSGGFAHAVDFCNTKATYLTDSLSKETYKISRISEKNRNPNNAASASELSILNSFSPEKMQSIVEEEGKTIYYKAIKIGMPTCLKCHGTSETIDPEAAKMIKEKYPNDKATGYSEGDLRGAWKIVFEH